MGIATLSASLAICFAFSSLAFSRFAARSAKASSSWEEVEFVNIWTRVVPSSAAVSVISTDCRSRWKFIEPIASVNRGDPAGR